MKLSDLPGDPGRKQQRKRIGRGEGSGHGKTAGHGHKGADARSGATERHGFEGGQMPFYRRVPKRGFTNPFRVEYVVVNLDRLNAFDDGAEVTSETMYAKGILRKRNVPLKVLGQGELTKKLTIRADAFSASAREKIEAAGGKAETI